MQDFIYHYTSIETLALILEGKKIKFSSLENMDDLNESQFSDEDDINFSSHTLISCWTKNDEENLAFWKMYTPDMKGVRIKIPRHIFENYIFLTDDVVYVDPNTLIIESLVPKSECFNENYWIIPFKGNLVEVVYTEDDDLLRPKIYDKETELVSFSKVAKYKSTIWQFQQEIRFKLTVLPTKDKNGNNLNPLNDFKRIMHEKIRAPFAHYFLEMRNEAFEKMEITLGPKCTLAEEIIVQSLLDKFNPNAKIEQNKFKGLIK
ncbi:hypothetical protein QGN23_00565 [Chryseobacterium gotjawalense]|uniref:DUF2971 domain-containing protein n=1 Tax=Chryseobacterium gotjawalense TaxID=3042315 RepID=A0ABY8RD78_9FLAO|nr:hypothetical protein [Chryseobacterium sp. wdc7]WHF51786.1 hypothetical protein QGN23_00565 [Chryseobacterium sp. wdc7]